MVKELVRAPPELFHTITAPVPTPAKLYVPPPVAPRFNGFVAIVYWIAACTKASFAALVEASNPFSVVKMGDWVKVKELPSSCKTPVPDKKVVVLGAV
jgi:hypothetical protein